MCSKHLLHHPRARYVVIRAKQAIHLEDEINDGNIDEGKRICENTSLTSCIRPTYYYSLYCREMNELLSYVYRKKTTDTIEQTATITIMPLPSILLLCVFSQALFNSLLTEKRYDHNSLPSLHIYSCLHHRMNAFTTLS